MRLQRGVRVHHSGRGVGRDLIQQRNLRENACFIDRIITGGGHERGAADVNVRFARQAGEPADEIFVVRDELVFVRPILRLRIIGAKFDHHDVRFRSKGFLERRLLLVRFVAVLEQGGAVDPEILHHPFGPQHAPKLAGIRIALGRPHAVCDAVTHAGDANGRGIGRDVHGRGSCRHRGHQQRQENEMFFHRLN